MNKRIPVPEELLEEVRKHLELHASEYGHPGQPKLIAELRALLDGPGVKPVAYHDKDQPEGIAWCPGYPEKLKDISPLYLVAPSAPVTCQHEWRDWNPSGVNIGRAVVWCHKCDALAFAGSEHLVQHAPAPVQEVPDGWQWVPKKETHAMHDAVMSCLCGGISRLETQKLLDAYLAAAPQPDKENGE